MALWTIAKKDLRLLVRDRRALLLLVAMPLLFILILGLLLGESFGQKPDDRQRVTIVDLDQGYSVEENISWLALVPSAGCPSTPLAHSLGAAALVHASGAGRFPHQAWSKLVQHDLAETAEIRLETIGYPEFPDPRQEAERLIREHKRAAVLVFEPDFSRQLTRCSFMIDGINPFHRDGVHLEKLGATLMKDDKQPGEAAIIEQIAQVTLLRVTLPYMIGRAFDRLSQPAFVELLGSKVALPVPPEYRLLVKNKADISLNDLLNMAARNDLPTELEFKRKVGTGIQDSLEEQFKKYDLTGKTWAALTKSKEIKTGEGAEVSAYVNKDGSGILNRGAHRYQVLVPAYTVMFAFFLVLTMGWLFVAERRQGTLKRLRAAPVTRAQIVLGKLLPCFLLSIGQELFLLVAGKLLFGLRWGPESWSLGQQLFWLLPVVVTTSLAAMGLALLVAALARTEIQVALYGAVPVLILALVGGCVLPREMMPEHAQQLSRLTPHGWALDAYRELLDPNPNSNPNLALVGQACGVLAGFGLGFLALAWRMLKLE